MKRIDEFGEFHSPNICFQGGSGNPAPSGSTTTTQNTAPWQGQQPFLTGMGGPQNLYYPSGSANIPGAGTYAAGSDSVLGSLPSAAELYQNYAPQYYPGTTYAPENPAQSSALQGTENLGLGGSPVTYGANQASANILNPNFLTSNPGNAGNPTV